MKIAVCEDNAADLKQICNHITSIMEGLSGIDTARKIRAINQSCIIIFITVSKDHSLEAYSVDGSKALLLHVGTHIYVTRQKTMAALEKELGGEPFLRCHRSYIVNMNYIKTLEKGLIKLKNGGKVLFPIRSYVKVQKAFGNYLTNKLREDLI